MTAGTALADTAQLCRDPARLAAFAPYAILDTPREAEYDDLVRLAAQACAAPIAVVNFVLAERQWFKAEVGLGLRETPLDVSICRHVLLSPGLTVIPDLRDDARLAGNPLLAGDAGLRFYAGYLLATPEGVPLGTLCVLDRRPRPAGLAAPEAFALTTLARQLSSQLELRRLVREQRRLIEQQELLFEELNHRVANSLQLVASVLTLQSARPPTGDVPTLLREARQRVLTVAALHRQLCGSRIVGEVDLGAYLREVTVSVARSASIETRFAAAEPVRVATERAVAVAMIVNELLTNAVKHARPDGPRLLVQVAVETTAGGGCAVLVEDNGAGLPPGFEPGRSPGLGLRIIHGLAAQLRGRMEWRSEGGTRFRLDLPPA